MDSVSAVLEAALRYASDGRPVFPCNGKRPYVARGLHDATTDPATIEGWWDRWPDANVAIRTGSLSGVLVVDVDDHDALHALAREHGELPRTASVVTPRGGQHYWFRHPGGEIPSSAGKIATGIDIRADGGYVIAPGSSGYVVDEEAPLAEPPGWLLERARRHSRNGKAPAVGDVIPAGRRNAELTSLAGTMRRRGMGAAEIEAALQVANRERCQPQPLDEQEVAEIAASVARYEPAEKPAPTNGHTPVVTTVTAPVDTADLLDGVGRVHTPVRGAAITGSGRPARLVGAAHPRVRRVLGDSVPADRVGGPRLRQNPADGGAGRGLPAGLAHREPERRRAVPQGRP